MSSRHRSAADIARCDGYAWNLRDKLGKGSYGDVYKGWNSPVMSLIDRDTSFSVLYVYLCILGK